MLLSDKRLLRGRSPVLFFLALAGALFLPLWLSGSVIAHFDLQSITIPVEDLFARYQRQGQLPLWAPEIQGGYPVIANGIQSFFYFPHVLLRQFLPGVWVANVSLALHLTLAAVFLWLFLRAERLSSIAALAGAVTCGFGGFFVGHMGLPHQVFPAAWIPATLWAFSRWRQTRRWGDLLLLSLVTAAMIYAGHIQMAVYGVGILALVAGVAGLQDIVLSLRRAERRSDILGGDRRPPGLLRFARNDVGALCIVIILVLLLTAVQILPTRELMADSIRGVALSRGELLDVSYPPAHALTWVFPRAFGKGSEYFGGKNEFELASTFGLTASILGLLALTSRATYRSLLGRTALALLVVGALLALGEHSPLYRWLVNRGFITRLANPARFFIFVHLGWSILVALGLAVWEASSRASRVRRVALAAVVLAVVLTAALFTLPVETRARVVEEIRTPRQFLLPAIVFTVLIVASLRRVPSSKLQTPSSLLALLLTAELVLLGARWNPRVPAVLFLSEPQVLAALPRTHPAPRVLSHATLFVQPRAETRTTVGPVVPARRLFRQSFSLLRDTLSSAELSLTWNGRDPEPGELVLTVRVEGAEPQTVRVSGERVERDGGWVNVPLRPIAARAGTRAMLELSSTYRNARRAPFVVVATDPDFEPTGHLTVCRTHACEPGKMIVAHELTDLLFRARYDVPPVSRDRELLLPLWGESFGVEMVRGHFPLQFSRVARYLFDIGERRRNVSLEHHTLLTEHRSLLDRFSVGFLLAAYEGREQLAGLPDVREKTALPLGERTLRLYENTHALPRVQMASRVYPAGGATPDQLMERLRSGSLSSGEVIAESVSGPREVDGNASATLVSYAPTRVQIRVQGEKESFLVLRDVLAPGWHATLDGRAVQIHPTDVLFRGVAVPPGEHEVVFRYVPVVFWRSAAVSAVAWAVVLLALAAARRRYARYERREESVPNP